MDVFFVFYLCNGFVYIVVFGGKVGNDIGFRVVVQCYKGVYVVQFFFYQEVNIVGIVVDDEIVVELFGQNFVMFFIVFDDCNVVFVFQLFGGSQFQGCVVEYYYVFDFVFLFVDQVVEFFYVFFFCDEVDMVFLVQDGLFLWDNGVVFLQDSDRVQVEVGVLFVVNIEQLLVDQWVVFIEGNVNQVDFVVFKGEVVGKGIFLDQLLDFFFGQQDWRDQGVYI